MFNVLKKKWVVILMALCPLPGQAQQSVFFDPDTTQQLLDSYAAGQDALRNPPVAPPAVADAVFEPAPEPSRKLKVRAIIYVDNGAWATWINDSKVTSENHSLDGIDITGVSADAVTLKRTDAGKSVRMNAAVAQTADPATHTVGDLMLGARTYLNAQPDMMSDEAATAP
jgi:hypothetical protein